MQLDYVTSAGGSILLINCDVALNISKPRILTGLAYIQGGLPQWVEVFSPTHQSVGKIRLSASVQACSTEVVLFSKNDDLEFDLQPCS